MNTAPTIRKGRKYEEVLGGARAVFMRDGFEGASVDDIARAAGVSKATLYSYFPDKRILFIEVSRLECERMAQDTGNVADFSAPPREVMTTTANTLLRFLLSEFSLQMFRICSAEAKRFPELGQAFYQSGPEMGCKRMAAYLRFAIERGEIICDDPQLMAEQFTELCKAKLWPRAIFGVQTSFTDAEISEVVTAAVDTILARYGA
ncbi:TetR/AcrR family transcriptional regulator [Lentibacter algarum]|uniref:TetR/AcrR family transcriptional regulator n=1 Tax=Lentibacter algarum TaxID=576131 RepID=UPI001C06590C|nr:TetR/AcrR family transcriptional regulator [Lentibacter algarum]MBU2981533.1 TetR/AcrR family transcriptional regulator [Lentibacter algarum]